MLDPKLATGIDISQHNGVYIPTAKPVDFVIARCSIGIRADAMFDANLSICASINRLFMAYHFYKTNLSWKEQADFFLDKANDPSVKMLSWDSEPGGNILTPQTAKDAVTAMSYLRQQSGKPVGLYADRQRT